LPWLYLAVGPKAVQGKFRLWCAQPFSQGSATKAW